MADDDDAPWLAAAPAPSTTKRSLTVRIIAGLAALATVAIIIVFILLRPGNGTDEGYMEADQAPLITAEPGPFKVKPVDPRGLDVEGQGDTMYAAGAGIDQPSDIDLSAAPEDPLPRPGTISSAVADTPPPAKDLLPPAMQTPAGRPASPAPAPIAAAIPAPVKPPSSSLAVSAATSQVQLGAFSTRARAEAAWARLVVKHGLLGLTPRYISTQNADQTLWRLRAATPAPAALCARLGAAGDPCTEVKP